MRALRFFGLVLALLFLGCGARSAGPDATEDGTTTSGDPTNAPATEGDEVAQAPEGPCSSWDPAADPTAPPLDVAAPPATASRGIDGLRFCILRPGSGEQRPTRDDRVRVHYTGWTTDGQMFDSSHARGEPAAFGVSDVIRGWTYSLVSMTPGQVRRVWIPEELAYQGRPGRPAGMLVFDIELVEIE
ncbi:MAG: FKBP-type peptidyl-prolyl cis-trans isomerase [Myxococcota bacterium]|nr:FKBP-type peptidyl-prolyl cis-trans isomerase [Myxococcota bacterium]